MLNSKFIGVEMKTLKLSLLVGLFMTLLGCIGSSEEDKVNSSIVGSWLASTEEADTKETIWTFSSDGTVLIEVFHKDNPTISAFYNTGTYSVDGDSIQINLEVGYEFSHKWYLDSEGDEDAYPILYTGSFEVVDSQLSLMVEGNSLELSKTTFRERENVNSLNTEMGSRNSNDNSLIGFWKYVDQSNGQSRLIEFTDSGEYSEVFYNGQNMEIRTIFEGNYTVQGDEIKIQFEKYIQLGEYGYEHNEISDQLIHNFEITDNSLVLETENFDPVSFLKSNGVTFQDDPRQ